MKTNICLIYLLICILEFKFCYTIEVNCKNLLLKFANVSSEFVQCAIYNARPITLCENCVHSYITLASAYHSLSNHSDDNGPCIDNFLNLDRLQIVQTLYDNNFNLWNRAKCYECFEIVDGVITANKSDETIHFDKLHTKFMDCLNSSDVNDTNICSTCMNKYIKLNDYYLSISNENEKIGVCMDIVDVMNTTRTYWSKKCCKARQHPEYIFLGSSIIVILVTVLFYVLANTCSDKKRPTILQQSRFAGSLTHFYTNSE